MTWWEKLFGNSNNTTDDNKDPELITERQFLDLLRVKGFYYCEHDSSWQRVWVVATQVGAERSREVYKKVNGKWKVVMYGNEGDVFFEHEVDSALIVKKDEEYWKRKDKENILLRELRGKYGRDYEKYDT